jgi:hypothetical protein
MDSALGTAARALCLGDPLTALKLVALREDPAALALRGIAMAQLGELAKSRKLLRRAARLFGDAEPVARARATVAEAEVALALRELGAPSRELDEACELLSQRGDLANACLGQLIAVRKLALLGEGAQAERRLRGLSLDRAPARLVALCSLIEAELGMKRLDASVAEQALSRARSAAAQARIPALLGEVERAEQRLAAPVARLRRGAELTSVQLSELEALFGSEELVVDACRRQVRFGRHVVSLITRPLLLELLVKLAEAAPASVPRDQLIFDAFGARRVNESHRVRLRVEIGRLRKLLVKLARIDATAEGFALTPLAATGVVSLLPPADGEASALLSLLSGGEAWSTSALAAAIGKSQRAVQRALGELTAEGKVRAAGHGPARRWTAAPTTGIATTLLLVAPGTLG